MKNSSTFLMLFCKANTAGDFAPLAHVRSLENDCRFSTFFSFFDLFSPLSKYTYAYLAPDLCPGALDLRVTGNKTLLILELS